MTFVVLLLTLALAAANGANDVAKGVATLAGSGITRYRTAIAWGAATTLVGAVGAIWLGDAMRVLFASGIVDITPTPRFAAAVLVGTAGWIGFATAARLPVSTTHALVGSLLGAGLLAAPSQVRWLSLVGKVALPLLLSAVVAYLLSALLTQRTSQPVRTPMRVAVLSPLPRVTGLSDRVTSGLHWLSAGAVGAARGLNDTPKLAAVAGFALVPAGMSLPAVFMAIAAAMVGGALVAGLRITRRIAEDVIELDHASGFGANLTTALLVGAGASGGLPMSTTHVSTGAIAGVAGSRVRRLKLCTLRDFALAWTLTPLIGGAVAAGTYLVAGDA